MVKKKGERKQNILRSYSRGLSHSFMDLSDRILAFKAVSVFRGIFFSYFHSFFFYFIGRTLSDRESLYVPLKYYPYRHSRIFNRVSCFHLSTAIRNISHGSIQFFIFLFPLRPAGLIEPKINS